MYNLAFSGIGFGGGGSVFLAGLSAVSGSVLGDHFESCSGEHMVPERDGATEPGPPACQVCDQHVGLLLVPLQMLLKMLFWREKVLIWFLKDEFKR